jgi:D-amino-acid dehydrogenase
VPIIDRTPDLQNVFVAAGHQMIGLLSAPGTARLLADLVTGQKPLFEPGPFRASR